MAKFPPVRQRAYSALATLILVTHRPMYRRPTVVVARALLSTLKDTVRHGYGLFERISYLNTRLCDGPSKSSHEVFEVNMVHS